MILKPAYTQVYKESVSFDYALGYAYEGLVNGPVPFDAGTVWSKLSERIAQGIYVGSGLLLPHTRVAGLSQPLMAFVVAPNGITNIKISDRELPQFMCILLSPEESATAHTQAIAAVARLLLNPEWKDKALKAETPAALLNLFA
ncbi:MAG: PTS sugar transporter subunit IIA [Fibrobacter sp.]|nr:PTS sugar transporter subunit IIA [Fibrobacter sp.]